MPTTVILSEYNFTLKCGKDERIIPYASIVQVNLTKARDKVFKASLRPDGEKTIVITNRYFQSAGAAEDRSRAYSTFIRVLHFHLKDKSKARFTSGNRSFRIGFGVVAIAFISFVMSFLADFYGFRLLDPVVQGVLLTVLLAVVFVTAGFTTWPRTYYPTEIPMEFLP
jgi:hypothetical protein